jgi:hypothetical protein
MIEVTEENIAVTPYYISKMTKKWAKGRSTCKYCGTILTRETHLDKCKVINRMNKGLNNND